MNSVGRAHLTRLHRIYRSAGWPCNDAVELDLLAAGLLERRLDACGRESLTLTTTGIQALHERLTSGRARLNPHERLCRATAEWLAANGRIAFLNTSFRAKVDGSWRIARPDVVAIRRTTREELLAPAAYEIKVSRADLLGDIARADKRRAYHQVATEVTYVVAGGIGTADDIPGDCGLIAYSDGEFRTLRAAPREAVTWSFANWMSLVMSERVGAGADALPQPDLRSIF